MASTHGSSFIPRVRASLDEGGSSGPGLREVGFGCSEHPLCPSDISGCVSAAVLTTAFPGNSSRASSHPGVLARGERPPPTGPRARPSGRLTSSTELLSEKPPRRPQVTASSPRPQSTSESSRLLRIPGGAPDSDAPCPLREPKIFGCGHARGRPGPRRPRPAHTQHTRSHSAVAHGSDPRGQLPAAG